MKRLSTLSVSLALVLLCVGAAGAAFGFTSNPLIRSARSMEVLSTDGGVDVRVTVRVRNMHTRELRGFYYTDNLPSDARVVDESLTINTADVTWYKKDIGQPGEIYQGSVPYRWILESPPGYPEQNPIPPRGELTVTYRLHVDDPAAVTTARYVWVGYVADEQTPVFGYETTDRSHADFDGDGIPDIFWRNSLGHNALWYLTAGGASVKSVAGVPGCGPSWAIAGIADFDNDGVPDILWREPSTGANALWYMQQNGTQIKGVAGMPSCGTSWRVIGTADFDGDRQQDILWRNAAGHNAIWYLQNAGRSIKAVSGLPSLIPTWSAGAVADVNDDGIPDILWRHGTTEYNMVWYLDNEGTRVRETRPMPSCAIGWSLAKVTDFDGDGVVDILWRNSSGQNVIWYMDIPGSVIREARSIPRCSTAWTTTP